MNFNNKCSGNIGKNRKLNPNPNENIFQHKLHKHCKLNEQNNIWSKDYEKATFNY